MEENCVEQVKIVNDRAGNDNGKGVLLDEEVVV